MIRSFLFTLLCLLPIAAFAQSAGVSPAQSPACNQSVIYDGTTTGATKLVSSASNTKGIAERIYICGFTIWSAGTTNVSLEYGTGANCGSSTVAITPAFQLTASKGFTDGTGGFRGLLMPTANDLCINSSGTTIAVQAIVYYAQF